MKSYLFLIVRKSELDPTVRRSAETYIEANNRMEAFAALIVRCTELGYQLVSVEALATKDVPLSAK